MLLPGILEVLSWSYSISNWDILAKALQCLFIHYISFFSMTRNFLIGLERQFCGHLEFYLTPQWRELRYMHKLCRRYDLQERPFD